MARMSRRASVSALLTSVVAPRGGRVVRRVLDLAQPQGREGQHLARAVVQVAADPAQLPFRQRRVALRSAADAIAQLFVLIEQLLELCDLLLKRDLLVADGVAALADDAEQEQVDDGDTAGHGQPRLELRALHLLVDLGRQLVELGRANDAVAAALRARGCTSRPGDRSRARAR